MITPWVKLSEEPGSLGYRKMLHCSFQLPDGRVDRYDIKDEGRLVAILALTAEDKVVLARQYRPGPGEILMEVPGGGVEPGETPEAAAARELLEETGYAGELRPVGQTHLCAYSNARQYNFVATNCCRVQPPAPEANEFIEVIELPLDAFRDLLRSGQLTDVATGYLGLDTLGLL